MIATKEKLYTFAEYLNYRDSTDNKYELFNGELIFMAPASGKAKSRIPDLMILTAEQCQEIRNMTTAVIEFPPLLVVEIVRPGNADDDYRYKRSEYAVRGIPEYWIIDPIALKISVLTLISGFYELAEFNNKDRIISVTFTDLQLTPQMVFE
ncbi:Uma2 family endonuclease [Microcystis sp. LSC13-02]|uniref:Uma2 family endonuclease n=1 Tax=Microcystis sp. LSC13-02 TaxID=1895004 RepID=UPI00257AC325|nr:Uma2 family endonuclease [Microcystis sp. LSC13-02]